MPSIDKRTYGNSIDHISLNIVSHAHLALKCWKAMSLVFEFGSGHDPSLRGISNPTEVL